jgi:magnesium-transporting ATPase (P-type)
MVARKSTSPRSKSPKRATPSMMSKKSMMSRYTDSLSDKVMWSHVVLWVVVVALVIYYTQVGDGWWSAELEGRAKDNASWADNEDLAIFLYFLWFTLLTSVAYHSYQHGPRMNNIHNFTAIGYLAVCILVVIQFYYLSDRSDSSNKYDYSAHLFLFPTIFSFILMYHAYYSKNKAVMVLSLCTAAVAGLLCAWNYLVADSDYVAPAL